MYFISAEGEVFLRYPVRDKRTGMGISGHGIQQESAGSLVRHDLQFYSEGLEHRRFCFCGGEKPASQ